MSATLGASNLSQSERAQNDFYATDPRAVHQLLEHESFASDILEPCCGQGHIADALKSHGYCVLAQDLYDYGYGTPGRDFLSYDPRIYADQEPFDIITNPPYSLATEFVLHALDILPLYHRAAFFCRLQFLEGADRFARLFSLGSLERVYVSAKRFRCARNGDFANIAGDAICFAWFIWRKGFRGAPTIRWFNTPDIQLTLPI